MERLYINHKLKIHIGMQANTTQQVKDFAYQVYNKRQNLEIDPETVTERLQHLKKGNKFSFENNRWIPNDYVGYAFVAMPNETINPGMEYLLLSIQERILHAINEKNVLYPLPSDSFHQTLANLLSNKRYFNEIVNKGHATAYPYILRDAVNEIPESSYEKPIRMRLTGVSAFGSCIAILGDFYQASDYKRIMDFRQAIYSNKQLNQLNIKRTRPFVGHITLIYLEKELTPQQRTTLANIINTINKELAEEQVDFYIPKAELRSYDNLATFNSSPNYPEYHFIKTY